MQRDENISRVWAIPASLCVLGVVAVVSLMLSTCRGCNEDWNRRAVDELRLRNEAEATRLQREREIDLLTEAKHLAERGWLPGIEWMDGDESASLLTAIIKRHPDTGEWSIATEADLYFAARDEIERRDWECSVDDVTFERRWTISRGADNGEPVSEPGTATLSLLRALRLACESSDNDRVQ